MPYAANRYLPPAEVPGRVFSKLGFAGWRRHGPIVGNRCQAMVLESPPLVLGVSGGVAFDGLAAEHECMFFELIAHLIGDEDVQGDSRA